MEKEVAKRASSCVRRRKVDGWKEASDCPYRVCMGEKLETTGEDVSKTGSINNNNSIHSMK